MNHDTKNNTGLHQQMCVQNPTPKVDRQGTQHYTLENYQATTHRKLNKEVKRRWIGHILWKLPESITHSFM